MKPVFSPALAGSVLSLLPVVPVLLMLAGCEPAATPLPASEEERTAYAIGRHLGQRLREMEEPMDLKAIVEGFRDGIDAEQGDAALTRQGLSPARVQEELNALSERTGATVIALRQRQRGENLSAAEGFFEENLRQEGVVELSETLQYRILQKGSEAPPTLQDRVKLEYEGRLLDGSVFDSSKDRGGVSTVRVQQTLPAWQQVLPLVDVGGEVELWTVPAVGAAEMATGLVEPGEVLVFRIRVLSADRLPPRRR